MNTKRFSIPTYAIVHDEVEVAAIIQMCQVYIVRLDRFLLLILDQYISVVEEGKRVRDSKEFRVLLVQLYCGLLIGGEGGLVTFKAICLQPQILEKLLLLLL